MRRDWPIALVQARPAAGPDPVAELVADVDAILAEQPGTRMVVFPEIHLLGAMDDQKDPASYLERVAEPLTGPLVTALGKSARAAGVWLVPGSVAERAADGRIFNTAVVLDPDGRLVSWYRKVFPWRPTNRGPQVPASRPSTSPTSTVGWASTSATTAGSPRRPARSPGSAPRSCSTSSKPPLRTGSKNWSWRARMRSRIRSSTSASTPPVRADVATASTSARRVRSSRTSGTPSLRSPTWCSTWTG